MGKYLVTGDWHERLSVPRCRKQSEDEWVQTQRETIRHIVGVANELQAALVHTGDLFHQPSVGSRILIMLLEELAELKVPMYFIYGNHEMRERSESFHTTSFGVFQNITSFSDGLFLPAQFKFAVSEYDKEDWKGVPGDILLKHVLVFESEKDFPPGADAITARTLAAQFPEFKYILTGDMHDHFHKVIKSGGKTQHVINPGCTTVQSAKYIGKELGMYLLDTDADTVEWVPLPMESAELTDDSYIEEENEREERVTAFVESLKSAGHRLELDFDEKVKYALVLNKVHEALWAVIKEIMEEVEDESID